MSSNSSFVISPFAYLFSRMSKELFFPTFLCCNTCFCPPEDTVMVFLRFRILRAIIAIIIAAIVSVIILGLPKRKYFRCKTCNHGAWKLNEKDSDGKKIMETHEEHEIEYLNKKQYDDYRKNNNKKYGYA